MKNQIIPFCKQIVFISILFLSSNLIAQNNFDFKLEKPTTTTLSLKASEKVDIEITFNADAVNKEGAYIATFSDGKMTGFAASTTMESPFTDDIAAKYFKPGNHQIEYILLPTGSRDSKKALAKISLQLTVENSPSTSLDVQTFMRDIVKTISTSNQKAFEDFVLNQDIKSEIVKSITGDSNKELEAKKELSTMPAKEIRMAVIENFQKLQNAFSEKGADIELTRFQIMTEKNIKFETDKFSVNSAKFMINSGETTFRINIKFFIINNKAYLFDFGFNE